MSERREVNLNIWYELKRLIHAVKKVDTKRKKNTNKHTQKIISPSFSILWMFVETIWKDLFSRTFCFCNHKSQIYSISKGSMICASYGTETPQFTKNSLYYLYLLFFTQMFCLSTKLQVILLLHLVNKKKEQAQAQPQSENNMCYI